MKTLTTRARELFPSAFVSLMFLLAYVLFYIKGGPLFSDADTPWHIAVGNNILELGRLPATDPWSFTAGEHPYYIISWLWDIGIALLQRIGGDQLLFVLLSLNMALVVGLVCHHISKREGTGTDTIIFTLLMAALSLCIFISARSQLAGFLFVAYYHYTLYEHREGRVGRRLFALPLIMIIWVNMHGSFMVGFSLLWAYWLEAWVQGQRARLRQLVQVTVLCSLALLCNPYGIGLYQAVMGTMGSVMKMQISEWQPYNIGISNASAAWVIMMILSAGFASKRIPLADKLITGLWLVALLMAVRNIAIFIVVSAPFMALSLQELSNKLESFRLPRPDIRQQLARPGLHVKLGMLALLVPIASFWTLDAIRADRSYVVGTGQDVTQAVRWFAEHCKGKRFLNDYDYGGRIIYETGGSCPVFVDGRAGTVYPESLLSDYLDFKELKPGWFELIERYGIDGMFLGNGTVFARAYADGQYRDKWQEVYRDNVASIYLLKK